jgi:hypothetical protein
LTRNVPKPENLTVSPSARVSLSMAITNSIASVASLTVRLAFSWTALAMSALSCYSTTPGVYRLRRPCHLKFSLLFYLKFKVFYS